jgi:hypothetical protein
LINHSGNLQFGLESRNELRKSTLMKIYRILGLGAALVFPQLVLAKLPFTNDAFGRVEGTLDFCAQADAQAAPKYEERKKSLVREVPAKEVDEARQTREYRDAYDWTIAELGKVPKAQASKACGDFLEGK